MKFCVVHWENTKQAIKRLGAWDLVATTCEEAASQLVEELQGVGKTLERFDPLMATHNMILSRALEQGGIYLMTENPDDPEGHYCPLCELAKHTKRPELADEWIDGASKAAVEYSRTLKPK